MLDLNKLQHQFNRIFRKETPKSFKRWLIKYRNRRKNIRFIKYAFKTKKL